MQFPKEACIPPWAADEWDRLGGTRLKHMAWNPFDAASMATRSPANPAPMHNRSLNSVSNYFTPFEIEY